MRILITGYYSSLFKDSACFKSRNNSLHENNHDRFIQLKKSFEKYQIELVGDDSIGNNPKIHAVICYDYPSNLRLRNEILGFNGPKYLIAEEVPIHIPENFSHDRKYEFNLIFTWYKNITDNKKVFYYFPQVIDRKMAKIVRENDIPVEKKSKKVFVGSQKKPHEKNRPLANYWKRDQLLCWYNDHAGDFDLYGGRWSRLYLNGNGLISEIFNWHRLDKIFGKAEKKFSKIYKGRLPSKYHFLNRYKFQFCLENTYGLEGNVTEKLHDAMICRNVPVYYPSTQSSVDSIYPSNLYINMLDFKNFSEMDKYLNGMCINEYSDYLERIDNFLEDIPANLVENYASDYLAKIIVENLTSLKN
jgi:hypothetical protein